MNQNLTDLLKRKEKQAGAGAGIDWDSRRKEYLAAVENLYKQIEAMFAEAIADKAVTLLRRSKQLSENYIGTYSADDLILAIGDEQVRFSPCGRNIAGAAGRVDVLGERHEAMLVVQPDSQWGIVQTRQPRLCVVPLNETTLAEVLELVMRDR